MKILLIIWLSLISCRADELFISKNMTFNDLFEQGFYPSPHDSFTVKFWSDQLTVRVEGIGQPITLDNCTTYMTFSALDDKLLSIMIQPESLPSLQLDLQRFNMIYSNIGIQLKTEGVASDNLNNTTLVTWAEAGGSIPRDPHGRNMSLSAKLYGDQLYTVIYYSSATGNDHMNSRKRLEAEYKKQFIESPKGWEHLPLRRWDLMDGNDRLEFLYRTSSYDEKGQLLPEFRKKLPEKKPIVKKPNIAPSREPIKRTETPAQELAKKPSYLKWFIVGGIASMLLCIWYFISKKTNCSP